PQTAHCPSHCGWAFPWATLSSDRPARPANSIPLLPITDGAASLRDGSCQKTKTPFPTLDHQTPGPHAPIRRLIPPAPVAPSNGLSCLRPDSPWLSAYDPTTA